jgi:hypothetical protein
MPGLTRPPFAGNIHDYVASAGAHSRKGFVSKWCSLGLGQVVEIDRLVRRVERSRRSRSCHIVVVPATIVSPPLKTFFQVAGCGISILSLSVVPRVALFHFKDTFGNGRLGFISICNEDFRFCGSSPNNRPSSSSIQALTRVRAILRIIRSPRASTSRTRTGLPRASIPPVRCLEKSR